LVVQDHFWAVVADCDGVSRAEISGLCGQLGLAVSAVATGAEALLEARSEAPALVVIDSDLTDPSGYEVCRELRDQFGETLPIVFVSSTRTAPHDEIAGLLLGADDYFNKPLQHDRFLARVRRLLARSPSPVRRSNLTPRECEILSLLVEGRRPLEIADRLCITRKTAATHIDHILAKLGAHSQAQAVAFAIRDSILTVR
jgi:DNA-binding NarL/FixJ family response regulator